MLNVAKFLYAILIFSIPFNGVVPILPAGEFSGDGFFYVSIPFNIATTILALASRKPPVRIARPLFRYMSVFLLMVLVPTIWNIPSILSNETILRDGGTKFVVSFGAVLYYFYTFLGIAIIADSMGLERFMRFSAGCFLASGLFMVFISISEIIGWYNDGVRDALISFRSIFAQIPERVQFRLSGVSYEPSFFSISMLTAIPWVIFYFKRNRSILAFFVIVLLVIACGISGARTAYVGLIALAAVWFLSLIRRPSGAYAIAAIAPVAMTVGLIIPLVAYSMLASFSNVSNISRSYLASRGVTLGLENPFGVGFGQVSFYVLDRMNSLIRLSWELEAWYSGDRAGQLTPVYSWYGRTIGEIGLIMYVVLAIVSAKALYIIFSKSLFFKINSIQHEVFRMGLLYVGLFFAIGLSTDSYKFLPFWFMILLLSAFMGHSVRRGGVSAPVSSNRKGRERDRQFETAWSKR